MLLVVLLAGVSVLTAAHAQLRCTDAAHEAARAAARGEDPATVVRAGERRAPTGARVSVRRAGGLVHVRVDAPWRPLGDALPALPVLTLAATAAAADDTAPVP